MRLLHLGINNPCLAVWCFLKKAVLVVIEKMQTAVDMVAMVNRCGEAPIYSANGLVPMLFMHKSWTKSSKSPRQ